MATKNKGKSSRKLGGQVEGVVQCPHLHFKGDIIDRNVLSKEQYLTLLSTPKGYHLDEYTNDDGEVGPQRRVLCSGRRMKKSEKVYIHNFLAEVWNLLTPEMVDDLKGMLMNEFGMSPQEANKFLQNQEQLAISPRPKSKQTLKRENRCNSATPMVIKDYLKTTFAGILASNLEERIIHALCGSRSKQKTDVAQRLLKLFGDVTGEEFTLHSPKSGTQSIMVFMADQLSVWMIDVVNAADDAVVDQKEKRYQGNEQGGNGDANDNEDDEDDHDDSEVEIIHRKKRPKQVSHKPGDKGDAAAGSAVKSKSHAITKKNAAEGSSGTTANVETKLSDKKKKSSTEGDGEKAAQTKSSKSLTQKKEGTGKEVKENKPKGDSNEQSKASGIKSSKPPSSAQSKTSMSDKRKSGPAADANDASKSSIKPVTGKSSTRLATEKSSTKPATEKSSSKLDTGKSSKSIPTAPLRRPSESFVKKDVSKINSSSKTLSRISTAESRPGADGRKRSQVSNRRPLVSENQQDKVGEVISTHLSKLIKDGSARNTSRAVALKDVISKKLESSAASLDQTGVDAIKAASALLAAYIDKQVESVELEYGATTPPIAVSQKGKGPTFSVKRAESSFAVREITNTEAASKTAKARGRPTPGAITLSKGGLNPRDTQEWAKWASDVVDMADKWSKWIETTVSKTVASNEAKKAGQEIPDWRDWKDKTGVEALEWRRNKKLLNESAAVFQDKMNHTKQPSK